jgi:hypothetical protein
MEEQALFTGVAKLTFHVEDQMVATVATAMISADKTTRTSLSRQSRRTDISFWEAAISSPFRFQPRQF